MFHKIQKRIFGCDEHEVGSTAKIKRDAKKAIPYSGSMGQIHSEEIRFIFVKKFHFVRLCYSIFGGIFPTISSLRKITHLSKNFLVKQFILSSATTLRK